MNEIVNLINSVGFPVVVSMGSLYYFTKQNDKVLQDNKERENKLIENHKLTQMQFMEQLGRYEEIMDKFNSTLLKLDARLENLEKKGGVTIEQ